MALKTLSEKLSAYRTDRPDEWTMDEFKRDAVKLEAERDEALAKRDKLRKWLSSERRLSRELKKDIDSANEKLAAMESQKPYITLHAEKGDYRIEWHHPWTLSEGSQSFYIRTVPADKPTRITEQDAREIISNFLQGSGNQLDDGDITHWLIREGGRTLLNKLNADREQDPSHSQQSADCSLVPNEVIRFLCGEGELDGLWFGERFNGMEKVNPFWWRKHLPKDTRQLDRCQSHESEGE